MAITVNVGQFPSSAGICPYELPEGSTVAAALSAAGLSAGGFDIRVGGTLATLEQVLSNGDSVMLVRKIKGNDEA